MTSALTAAIADIVRWAIEQHRIIREAMQHTGMAHHVYPSYLTRDQIEAHERELRDDVP
jgi:hypothetical protein